MLRKIDCVMLRVPDLDGAVDYYGRVFGHGQLWRDEVSVGMGMPETDAEIVLHTLDLPPGQGALPGRRCASRGRTVPQPRVCGAPRAVRDRDRLVRGARGPFGNTISILDTSTGLRR
ncbi:hypothetical protein [Actinocatenispora thailandica]|uniref:hypothetical protein n=1 Tax=Actinocatenispora thailandica TaxID=227318 RepID=UPI001951068E|nr:hypothetical protein [Actinocatenispora thailandica]